ncbi:MAG: AAA family ATPase [Candidatus Sumerlaeota bacterium]|nr:AAA family ATPase [Candidatus Sumerlaeota bacterium]
MKIKSLRMIAFRGIKDMALNFDDKLNVLVGINGSGKSSVLDSLAILLSRLVVSICGTNSKSLTIRDLDIMNGENESMISLIAQNQRGKFTWSLTNARKGRTKKRGGYLDDMHSLTRQYQAVIEEMYRRSEISEVPDSSESEKIQEYPLLPLLTLPLLMHYGVNRAVTDIPLKVRKRHGFFDPISAYDNAFRSKTDFRSFFEWFREFEDIENAALREYQAASDEEKKKMEAQGFDHKDEGLAAARKAIEDFTGFTKLRINRKPLQMELLKGAKKLIVDQLSDGEKCLLSLVGDLARRLSIANPTKSNPLKGVGIVLIDEIELHLHPKWQREVIPKMVEIFPNCQFIITTHSPQVLSHVKEGSVFLMKNSENGIEISQLDNCYGKNTDWILEIVQECPDRPQEIKDRIDEIYRLLHDGTADSARDAITILRNMIGADPEISKVETLLRRKEIIGR